MADNDLSIDQLMTNNPEDLVLALFVIRNIQSEFGERITADYNDTLLGKLPPAIANQVSAYNGVYRQNCDSMYKLLKAFTLTIGRTMGLSEAKLQELDTKSYDYSK